MKSETAWPLVTALAISGALYLIFVWAPTERTMGIVQRIFYFHMPPYFVAMVAIYVGLVASIRFLMTRDFRFDDLAVASIEVGLVFDTMNLLTGPMWAKPVWGIYWTWDARLTSAFVLWLMFVGYMILRRAVPDPNQRAAVSAVVNAFQAVAAVLVYLTIRWWRTQHPQPVVAGGEGSGLASEMWVVLIFSFGALLLLYCCLVRLRRRLERLRRETEALRRTIYSMSS